MGWTYVFDSKFGSPGTGTGQFQALRDVHAACTTRAYTADVSIDFTGEEKRFGCVQVFTYTRGSGWAFERRFESTFANGVAAHATDGKIYATNHGGGRAYGYGPTGGSEMAFGGTWLWCPAGIDITNDEIYVASMGADRNGVTAFQRSDGAFQRQVCSKAEGHFDGSAMTNGVCVADSLCYVTDWRNDKVYVYEADDTNKYIRQWSSNKPGGVAVANTYVYVTDQENDKVYVYSREGDLRYVFDGQGGSNGRLSNPTGISATMSANGTYVWVADAGNSRVQVFSWTYVP